MAAREDRSERPAWARGLRWVARAVLALIILFLGGFAVFVAAIDRQPQALTGRADAIVVLTGAEDRIDEAVRLLADHKGGRLLISGVNPRTTKAALQRQDPANAGLYECCIDIGYWAQNTPGNADEAQAWINAKGFTSVIVVTSSYHMPRSLLELRRVLPNVALIPHPVVSPRFKIDSWWANPGTARLIITEYMKLIPAMARLATARLIGSEPDGRTALADPDLFPKL